MKTAQNIWSTLNSVSPKIHIQVLRTRLHTETSRELELKYVPQLYWARAGQLLANFFLNLSQKSLWKLTKSIFFLLAYKLWRIGWENLFLKR